jgi:S1-C subfamily serine protease
VAAQVDNGLVDIVTTLSYQQAEAAGTGLVLTRNGEVLTNNHVIDGATAISVTDVGNGQTYRATVVGYDKSADVAVLQLQNASGLATVATTSSTPAVGAGVVGIGNAGGAGGTPSYAAGVITATDQTITASDSADGTSEQLTGLLETDANIVAGDSGGPLVNAQGQVVGMDTAASGSYRFTQASQAYAIPIGTALQIAQQIEAGQASDTVHVGPTAMLGVGVQPDSRFGGNGSGATIVNVMSGSPAANAGLTAGDTIVAVAGHDVTSATSLSDVMLQQIPGSTVTVRYLDPNGATHSVPVHLATGPPQ